MSVSSEDLFRQVELKRYGSRYDEQNESPAKIHKLPEYQIDQLRALFPNKTLQTSSHIPSSGLPYLESLTDLAVDETFQQMLKGPKSPTLIYAVGDCPQLAQNFSNIVWNIDVTGEDDFPDPAPGILGCSHHVRDLCECAGTVPDAYLFVHSLYYSNTAEIARALYHSNDKYAFSIHHPFKGAVGSLGNGEVQFEVSHGRVSTTRFPSFERSDLNWLYTRTSVPLYQSAPNTDEKLHLYETSPDRVVWTLSWRFIFDFQDIQVVRFDLTEGDYDTGDAQLDEPSLKSLQRGQLAYGQLREKTGLHVEQIWAQLALYSEGNGRKVYSLAQLQELLSQTSESSSGDKKVVQALHDLREVPSKPVVSSL